MRQNFSMEYVKMLLANHHKAIQSNTKQYIVSNGNCAFILNVIRLMYRSSPPEVFLGKGVLKICSIFTGEHRYRNAFLIKLLFCNFIEIALRHGCSPVNLLHIFRTPFPQNTSEKAAFEVKIFTLSREVGYLI